MCFLLEFIGFYLNYSTTFHNSTRYSFFDSITKCKLTIEFILKIRMYLKSFLLSNYNYEN